MAIKITKIAIISEIYNCLKFLDRLRLMEIRISCFNEDSNDIEKRNKIKQLITINNKFNPIYEHNKYNSKLPAIQPINKG